MAVRVIKKSLAGSEDLLLGFGTELQVRNDKNIEITKINASNIPYDETRSISDSITKKVGTLADIRAMNELPETVWCSGYHTKNDGAFGSHFYRLKGLKTTEIDNSGTLIVVSVGGSEYVYELQYDGAVNVKWFGAVGDGITDDIIAINSSLLLGTSIYVPKGNYLISSMIRAVGQYKSIIGEGSKLVTVTASNDFNEDTISGYTTKAMIYNGMSYNVWSDNNFQYGGTLSGFTLKCKSGGTTEFAIKGIIHNRLVHTSQYDDIVIEDAIKGIHGTRYGWGLSLNNVHIIGAVEHSILLEGAYNGVTFNGCYLWGRGFTTDTHLSIKRDSYGVIWSGGVMEDANIAVDLLNSQITILGVDFEQIKEKFMHISGVYGNGGTSLDAASPISSVSGCTFVGVPTQYGFHVKGGMLDVSKCFFIAGTAGNTTSTYAFYGEYGGDAVNDFTVRPCISTSNLHFRAWGPTINTGNVFNRINNLATVATASKYLTVDPSSNAVVTSRAYPTKLLGNSYIPSIFGHRALTTIAQDREQLSIRAYGDKSPTTEEEFISTYPDAYSGSIKIFSNSQGGSPDTSHSRVEFTANALKAKAVISTVKVELNTIGKRLCSMEDNTLSLGASAFRWANVYATTGAISTSDDRCKTYLTISDKETLVAKELKQLMRKFKFNDAIEEKGEDNARIHYGVSAQTVKATFEAHGLPAEDYALLCYDKWEEEKDEDGNVTTEAGDRYGIRYEELLCFIMSAL